MRIRFSIHEIEHEGDEDDAIAELTAAGCQNVKVVERPYNDGDGCDESMVVECTLPTAVTTLEALQQLCESTCIC